jgi:hypothetical protein
MTTDHIPKREHTHRELASGISSTYITFLSALPFVANFTAGAIAGIAEILTFYPLGELFLSLLLHDNNMTL